jgi:inosose dehydratase
MAFRIACHTITWGPAPDVERMLAEIAGAGYEGVELFQKPEILGPASQLRRTLDARSLVPVNLSGGAVDLSRTARPVMEASQQRLRYAAAVGATVATSVCGPRVPDGIVRASDYEALAANLEELCEFADPLGIRIAHHPHIGFLVEDALEVDRLMQLTGRLGLLVDTGHLRAAGSDPLEVLERHRSRVAYLHLKDWNTTWGAGIRDYTNCGAELGEGNLGIDFPGILRALREWGYDGWVTVELDRSRRTPAESCRLSRACLKRLGY